MVLFQIQLNDCIQNTTAVCNPRQNSVPDKIQSQTKFSPRQIQSKTKSENFFLTIFFLLGKIFFSEKQFSDFVLD